MNKCTHSIKMRFVSQLFQPLITIPKNAKIKNTEITCKSHKLLLECGLIHPTSSGMFALLPLARRSLDKLETLVRLCVDSVGGQRLSLPALTAAGLWQKTGRLENGVELMKIEDRHGKKFVLSPTHEEAITDLLADVGTLSYKQLPLLLYQITNKYRDEFRPKHGLLRSRDFLMMDMYGIAAEESMAIHSYKAVSKAYNDLFDRLNLKVFTVKAPSGDMGGTLSHEWQLLSESGEDSIHVCPSCSHSSLEDITCGTCGKEMETCNSIEVGHTFILGTKYSEALNATYKNSEGVPKPLFMSSYGIGLTRLLAASLEVLSTDTCLRWPTAIAPYSAIIIGPKEGSKEWQANGWEKVLKLHSRLSKCGLEQDILVDDRHHLTIGKKIMMADRMGYPLTIVAGRSSLEAPPRLEVFTPGSSESKSSPQLLTEDEIEDLVCNRLDQRVISAT